MAKIVVKFARDEFTTFGKYWGVFLFLYFLSGYSSEIMEMQVIWI